MTTRKMYSRRGVALLAALLFLAVFCALSVGFLSLSSANTQIARNHSLGNGAFTSAQSGYEVVRYLMDGIQIYGTHPAGTVYEVYQQLQSRISSYGMSCIQAGYDLSTDTISVSNVPLAASGKSFNFTISGDDADSNLFHTTVTGTNGDISRRISVNYQLATRGHTVFDFGIATKGPLLMSGQTSVTAANIAVESDVFIDAVTTGDTFSISNQALVQGNVHIVNPYASYTIGTKSSVGGATGEEAEDHVYLGADPVDFPTANPQYFQKFATGPIIDNTNVNDYSVLENAVIAAGTNPTFASDMVIKGVLYVEQPNTVKFSAKTTVQGIIAADSQAGVIDTANSLQFTGQVVCEDVSTLEGSQFDAIRGETGTFLMAPGFFADFTGQANVINGVMAVGGIRFTGDAGGTINGSIINYSPMPVTLQGQSELLFNRSGTSQNPAGFVPVMTVSIDQSSYSEI
ncbi:MAG: hypothetical protein JXB18_12170 [Sedimentisphaerales bacterium]|nr:hypothetical protein [Sedimentisphaerales bacterium]